MPEPRFKVGDRVRVKCLAVGVVLDVEEDGDLWLVQVGHDDCQWWYVESELEEARDADSQK